MNDSQNVLLRENRNCLEWLLQMGRTPQAHNDRADEEIKRQSREVQSQQMLLRTEFSASASDV